MSTEIRELLDTNFNYGFKAATYNNMRIALESYEQFKRKNEDFFTFDKRDTLFGYLRTYAVEKQFNDSAFNPKANYNVMMRQVNNFKYKALFIETSDFIINVGRTNNARELLPASLYKKELAKANKGLERQMSFVFNTESPDIIEQKRYAEIIYGYGDGQIKHLNIIIPSGDYSGIEYSLDLLENVEKYALYVPEEVIEESIVSLKKSLSEEVEKII